MVASVKTREKELAVAETSSVPALCLTATLRHGKADALNHKVGGEWLNTCATTFAERVRYVALGLAARGIRRGDRVALLSDDRSEWTIFCFIILSFAVVTFLI